LCRGLPPCCFQLDEAESVFEFDGDSPEAIVKIHGAKGASSST
jgi:hypothetical protein